MSLSQLGRQAAAIPCWQQAMSEELTALPQNGIWDLVPLPSGKVAIGFIKFRRDLMGLLRDTKLGWSPAWEYGMDYEETFAPVAKMTSVRTIIAVAAVGHSIS